MSWVDEFDKQPEPERQTGLDWIQSISEADQSRADRRVSRARRKVARVERKYQRKMKGSRS